MKTVLGIIVILLCLSMNACTTVVQGGVRQTYSPALQHVRVTVVNNCSASGDVELGGQVVKAGLGYGESFTVIITRPMLVSQYGIERKVTFKARIGDTYLGSATQSYFLDTNRSGNEEVWEVDHVRTANGAGGCRT